MKPKSSNVQNHNSFLQNKLTSEIYLQFEKIVKLKGNTSLMISEASNAPAKVIKEFRKKSDKPLLKGA